MMNASLLAVLKALTVITTLGLIFSPIPTYARIVKAKTTGDFSILPVTTICFCCTVWVIYSCLVGNYVPLVLVDSFGLAIAFAFMLLYYRYTADRKFVHRLWAVAGAGAVIVAVYVGIGLEGVTSQSQAQVAHVLGFLAAGLDILMSASPMATIRHIIAIKDASSMPLTMSIAGLINTILWVTVSWPDWFLVVPNLIASAINVAGIVVFFIYRPGKYTKATNLKDDVVRPSLASPGVAGKYAQMQSPTVELKRDEVLATP